MTYLTGSRHQARSSSGMSRPKMTLPPLPSPMRLIDFFDGDHYKVLPRCIFFYLYLSLPPSLPLSLSRFASRLTIRLVYGDQSRMNGGDQPKTKEGGNIIWAWEDSSAFLLGGAGSPTAVARGRVATCQTTHPRRRPRVMEGRRRLVNKWVSGSHSQAIRLIVGLEKNTNKLCISNTWMLLRPLMEEIFTLGT